MPFRIALSGLNAASVGLRTTSNNIANANTTGFRQYRAEFAARTAAGVGSGVRTTRVAQLETPASLQFTDNALDAAISGEGFFVVSDGGTRLYTRAGNFSVDADGYVINAQGYRLQAYPTDGAGQFNTSAPADLRLSTGSVSAVSVDPAGIVVARTSNGQSAQIGKIAIANFTNPAGLQPVRGTLSAETYESGAATLGEAGAASFGLIQTGALESSNVNLTGQLLDMIKYSRQFEMQAKVIRTASETAETVTNIVGERETE